MKFLKILRNIMLIVWVVLGATLVLGIIFLNIPPGGTLRVSAVPGEPSPFVGALRPEARTMFVRDVDGSYTEIFDEPAYFTLAVPAFFRRAIVSLEFQNDGQPIIELGARSHRDEWQFDLRPIDVDLSEKYPLILRDDFVRVLNDYQPPTQRSDGWKVAEAEFEFGDLAVESPGELQMIVSVPAMKILDKSVRVRRVWVEYERDPLTISAVWEALGHRFQSVLE